MNGISITPIHTHIHAYTHTHTHMSFHMGSRNPIRVSGRNEGHNTNTHTHTHTYTQSSRTGTRNPIRVARRNEGHNTNTHTHTHTHNHLAQVPEIQFESPDEMKGITGFTHKVLKERCKLTCVVCGTKNGACIQCARGACSTPFHAMCARKSGLHMAWLNDDDDNVRLAHFFCSVVYIRLHMHSVCVYVCMFVCMYVWVFAHGLTMMTIT
jgi:hypothetical protein